MKIFLLLKMRYLFALDLLTQRLLHRILRDRQRVTRCLQEAGFQLRVREGGGHD